VALGGPLLVAPAGSGAVVVTTDALQAHIERLDRLQATLGGDALALARLHPLSADHLASAPPEVLRSAHEVGAAQTLVRGASDAASTAGDSLRRAIHGYAAAEAQQHDRVLRLGAELGMALGPILRVLVVLALPGLLLERLVGFPRPAQVAAVRQWMLDHPEVVTSPGFVEAVRATTMSIDEVAGSVSGLPPGTVSTLASASGFVGVQAGAATVMAVGRPLGLFREGPISVDRVSSTPITSPAAGAAERLARVPEGEQVRIERYDAPGQPPRFVVYVGPTETFSPIADDEPWDLTSNVQGVAGLDAGSLRATRAAMLDAGVTADDEVQLIGFSQGGLVATRLAGSGDWNVVGLETYGAPAGNIELPAGLSGMAVRNTDDFIPALAGPQLDDHLLQVERQAFAEGSPIPTELPVPAHERPAYDATAAAIDDATSQAVRQQVAAMDAFTADYRQRDGSTITAMVYQAERGAAKGVGAR